MPRMDGPVENLRIRKVLPFVEGKLLDLGCGYNNLVREAGQGIGVDVYPWEGIDVLIGDAARLPFPSQTFDTVAIVAALNHIPNREMALCEVNRVLIKNGRLLLTMISPWVGQIAHLLFTDDENMRGGLGEGEEKGLSQRTVHRLVRDAGFKLERQVFFELFLNRVYVARKR